MPLICLSSFYTQIHKRRTMMLQNGLEEKRGWWDGSSVYRGPAPSHEEQTVHPGSHCPEDKWGWGWFHESQVQENSLSQMKKSRMTGHPMPTTLPLTKRHTHEYTHTNTNRQDTQTDRQTYK